VADNTRIEELRRRVQKDPASIAFAQLAEEYRRAGSYRDAIATCRAGLSIHPGYLSARVTLGRALLEMNELDSARIELEYVLKTAPENLSAIRGVAEVHHRSGRLTEALTYYKAALALARHDPDLEQTVEEISRAISPAPPVVDDGLSFEQASAEFLAALEGLPGGLEAAFAPAEANAPDGLSAPIATAAAIAPAPVAPIAPVAPAPPASTDLPKLQGFLNRIQTHRQKKAV
jgi:tetratricopeptide (TPR) repeat protein